MASTQEYIDFVCAQLDGVGVIRAKKMFGDWCIYVDEKCVILACDNQCYVKQHPAIEQLMQKRQEAFVPKPIIFSANNVPYFEKQLDYRANILNHKTEQFYRRHGVCQRPVGLPADLHVRRRNDDGRQSLHSRRTFAGSEAIPSRIAEPAGKRMDTRSVFQ